MRRIDVLTNATDRDRSATLIEISENLHHYRKPDAPMTYRVTLPDVGGEVLLEAARDPEHQAARILRDRGVTGRLVTCYAGSDLVVMRMGIGWAAERRTKETRTEGPRTVRYEPMDAEARGRARATDE